MRTGALAAVLVTLVAFEGVRAARSASERKSETEKIDFTVRRGTDGWTDCGKFTAAEKLTSISAKGLPEGAEISLAKDGGAKAEKIQEVPGKSAIFRTDAGEEYTVSVRIPVPETSDRGISIKAYRAKKSDGTGASS